MSAPLLAFRAVLALVLSLLLMAGAWGGPLSGTARADSAPLDPTDPATPPTVSADALPTVQINGVVWSQAVVGNTVYAAGQFTRARPAGAAPGTQETVRNNLLAYDIRTGALITSFAPDLNAQAMVVAASPDGSRIYVGGDFSQANGQPRNRVAAYSTATGQLIGDFRPNVSSRVAAIATTGSTVYLGGTFTSVGSVSRHRLAAVSATNGALLPWNPVPGPGPVLNRNSSTGTSDVVKALLVTLGGSQVVVGGHFNTLNGVKSTGVGALDAVTGATRAFAVNKVITNQGLNGGVTALSTDGTNVYGTSYDYYGPGNLEGGFSAAADGGAVNWINDCHGDTYSSFVTGGAVYVAGHPHVCSNIGGFHEHSPRVHRYATAVSVAGTGTVGTGTHFNSRVAPDGTVLHKNDTTGNHPSSGTLLRGKPAPSLLPWFPSMSPGTYTGQGQAGWSVAGDDRYVVYGGEFPRVNQVGQQGLVRYAVPALAPNRVGPAAGPLTPTVESPRGGMARVSWQATTDQDNLDLTYRVYRDDDPAPIHEITAGAPWWKLPPMTYVDLEAPAGRHSYRVAAVDAFGNRANSPWVAVDVAAGSIAQRTYADAVRADGAQHLWPLGESGGGTAYDFAGTNDLVVQSGANGNRPAAGAAGAVGDGDTAYRFLGQSGTTGRGHLASERSFSGPTTFSLEAWFRTTSTAGGKIIGFGNSATGTSTSYDRHVYMDTGGRVSFGVYPGARRIVTGSATYNDGDWHHVVGSLSPAGMALYVDGELVGSRSDTTTAQSYTGYWRVGGDTSWSGQAFFAGDIDEPAVYPVALPADRVASHHSIGTTGEPLNLDPTATFSATVSDLRAGFDATSSSDSDGTVETYAWDFGDGVTGSGATVSHDYAAAGTYDVTLAVTDDDGATATVTKSVTVTAPPPNAAPAASLATQVTGLRLAVDGSGSTDADGTVAGYAWDFGDGSTGTGATAEHTYATPGEYRVTLTVTDDDGATATADEVVTVTGPQDPSVLASDAFERTVGGGLGTADAGGPWTVLAGGNRQSVASGKATLTLTPGTRTASHLAGVSSTSVDLRTSLALSDVPSGGGAFLYLPVRRVDTDREYRARIRVLSDGSVRVGVVRFSGSATETLIGGEQLVTGLRYTAGSVLQVRAQADGTAPTELAVSVWAAGSAEPSTPTVSRTDSTDVLQAPGSVGLWAYLSGSASGTVTLTADDFTAVPVGGAAPVGNTPPTAAFTATAEGLTVSLDGSGSTDADGTVAGHVWDFGDGTSGTGATAGHTYGAAGSYTVTLTVTDDDGATAATTEVVTVTAPAGPADPGPVDPVDPADPADPAVLVADAFDRTVSGGLGTAEVGGPWSVQFGGARQSVTPGTGRLALSSPRNSTGSFLGEVSQADIDLTATLALEGAPSGGGAFVYVTGRRVSETELYRARLRFLPDGTVRAAITRLSGSFDEVPVGGEVVVPGVDSTSGERLRVRLQITGSGTAELALTVWPDGGAEPATPTVSRSDSTPALQAAGGVGLSAYLSGSATAPVAVLVTDFGVRAAG